MAAGDNGAADPVDTVHYGMDIVHGSKSPFLYICVIASNRATCPREGAASQSTR